MNQYYSEELSQKSKRGMRETRLKGKKTGGRINFGYTSSNQIVSVNEEEAQVLSQIFTDYANGKRIIDIVADLNSRGHNSLTIKENGEIAIQRADQEVKQAALENVPEKTYWTRLAKVFESEGLAAQITENGMVLSW